MKPVRRPRSDALRCAAHDEKQNEFHVHLSALPPAPDLRVSHFMPAALYTQNKKLKMSTHADTMLDPDELSRSCFARNASSASIAMARTRSFGGWRRKRTSC